MIGATRVRTALAPRSDRPHASRWVTGAAGAGAAAVGAGAVVLGAFLVIGVTSGDVDWSRLLTSDDWSHQQGLFGAATMLWGTAVVSVIALLIALPLGWSAALALNELTPLRRRRFMRTAVELLAAVPSIVYGLLGVALLRPLVSGLFNVPGGDGLLTAGVLLGVMVLPTVVAVSVDALADVPGGVRETAAALGLSRSEVIVSAVLPLARGGMLAGGVLGLARALGETVAIFLVIGRADGPLPGPGQMLDSLLRPGQTITTKLGGPEPLLVGTGGAGWAALCALGILLLGIVAALTVLAQSRRLNRPGRVFRARSGAPRHRAARDRAVLVLLRGTLLLPVLFTVGIAIAVASRGTRALHPDFWLSPAVGASAGGVRDQVVGTVLLVAAAGVIAASLGLALALLIGEYTRPRSARWLRTGVVMLGGIPTILLGLAGYWFFGSTLGWGKSWLAGAVLLGLVAIPIVTLAITAQMSTLPPERLETARALGLRRSQVVRSVLVPHVRPALVTGLLLGLARAAGETAPLLFAATVFAGASAVPSGVVNEPVVSLPTHVFNLAQDAADPAALEAAWGSAAVLVIIIALLLASTIPIRRRLERDRA
ncbi:ABC transporter permease subunit [Thermomonospora umbrina]|uniref:Phosphate ABC transporter membrane protein 2 (PhoT family) n=1 Tax=Thermomonospora umbrina TaxID=111806 RepID=A0A3D9SVN7_9ACTN|nr:ABC transporter permease subunit [Thermomonospora umbrina]REE99996.1 phosphate ABC transporter membrane protein 2 (PhoT family) [Thermomonospora umbrina]